MKKKKKKKEEEFDHNWNTKPSSIGRPADK